MILLRKISLYQFRNYNTASFSFDQRITCITGKNGSGKTNLLDAIYTLCYTKSYFSATIQPTIMQGKDAYRIEGSFSHRGKEEQVSCTYRNAKKEVSCGGLVYEKQSEHIGKFAAVMIAPDDIELINEGSELRRKFIDGILGQSDRRYLEALLQYQKVLAQRNAWLKMYDNSGKSDQAQLDYYNSLLAEAGTYIFECRKTFIQTFLPMLQHYYTLLSGGGEQVSVQYQSDLNQHTLQYWLSEHLQHDIRYQRTLRGIHKDDLVFLLDGNPIKSYGSQGQKKSFLFSLKLAQFNYLRSCMQQSPLLLLDDVFEKLDQQRMEALLHIIGDELFGQVVITDTHQSRINEVFDSAAPVSFIHL
ncbi:MAG TPA: DNA replication and repair protein RecF [Chitinophagaceae bacterium]|nr:DNA replication and repair protein RecF [Chitinophagaceae bacterium]